MRGVLVKGVGGVMRRVLVKGIGGGFHEGSSHQRFRGLNLMRGVLIKGVEVLIL